MKKIYKLLLSALALCTVIGQTYAATDTPENGKYYRLKNVDSGKYMDRKADGSSTMAIRTLDENSTSQIFLFGGDTESATLKQLSSGEYAARKGSDAWTSSFSTDGENANSQYQLVYVDADDIFQLRTLGRSAADNYVAPQAKDDNATIYFDGNTSGKGFIKWEFETVDNETVLNLLATITLPALIEKAKTTLENISTSQFGYPEEAITAFKEAIAKAEAIDPGTISLEDLNKEITAIQAATRAFLESEKIPRLSPEPETAYRIVIIKESDIVEGNTEIIRYMGRYSADNDQLIPKKIDIAVNPEWQLFTFEQKEGGVIDEYSIKSVYTEKYINYVGQRANAAKDDNTWVAVYEKVVNGKPFFRFRANSETGYRWGVDGGTWPDAVTHMYNDRGDYLFTIEKNPTAFDNLQALISEATTINETSANPAAVKTYLTNAIATANAIEETAGEEAILQGVVDMQTAIDLFKEYESTLNAADAALAYEGAGFPADAKATFEAAINAAKAIEATDAAGIQEGLDTLKVATKAYQYSELKPWIKAIDGATYRILISDGTDVRYMTLEGNNLVPRALKEGNDKSQLFYFEAKEDGNLDEYYIKIASNNQYMDADGENTIAEKTASWAAVYDTDYNEVPYFKFWGSNMTRYWCTDNGTWPDAVSNMWHNKNKVTHFTTEYVAPTTTALNTIINEAEAFATQTADSIGTTDKKYPQEARTAFTDSIAEAKTVLTSQSQVAVDAATLKLTSALETYKAAKIVVDRSALEAILTEANNLLATTSAGDTDGSYTPEGRAAFEEAVGTAQTVFDNPDIIQADIDNAITALTEAIAAYEMTIVVIDFEALDALISATSTYAAGVTPVEDEDLTTAKATFEGAIATAKEIDRTAVNQEGVTEAAETLQAAFDNFIIAVKAKLAKAIENAEKYVESLNIPESEIELLAAKKSLVSLIGEAKTLNESTDPEEVIQTAIDAKVAAMEEAIAALETDYVTFLGADLTGLISEVQAFVDKAVEGNENGQYPSKTDIQTAIDAAEAFLKSADRTGDFAGEKTKLEAAFTAFKATVITKTGLDTFENNGINLYTFKGKLYITGLTDTVTISGYDLSGKTIFSESSSANEYARELPAGSYIISLQGYVNGSQIIIVE